jgi:hypothetical protein
MLGDNVHEYLAPCIYEGEGEMLGMAFFKSLVKHHGKTFFEPVGKAVAAAGIRKPNPLNPAHAWALRKVALPYLKWLIAHKLMPTAESDLPTMPPELAHHAEYACDSLQNMAVEISDTMMKFQLSLADRQCRMAELSARCQNFITILCTALYGSRQDDRILREAADVLCQELTQQLTGKRPSNAYFKQVTQLGAAIAEGQFPGLAELRPDKLLMPYEP